MDTGNTMSNGIAHFGGFITSLIAFFIYDARTEQRKYFHRALGIAIGMGIVWYGNYLVTLIHVVKGG
jgi:prolipoprotein diacylglyceryltransferase